MRLRKILLISYAIAFCMGSLACDPVHSAQVDALGGEVDGVPNGPLHRPGQPCNLCHDGALGDPPEFSVAGTVYEHTSDVEGADNVTVSMIDSNGSTHVATTNAAGNFYVTPDQWTPKFPIVSTTVEDGSTIATMYTQDSWAGSCNYCHTSPADQRSPGHISILLDDGGTPP